MTNLKNEISLQRDWRGLYSLFAKRYGVFYIREEMSEEGIEFSPKGILELYGEFLSPNEQKRVFETLDKDRVYSFNGCFHYSLNEWIEKCEEEGILTYSIISVNDSAPFVIWGNDSDI